MQNLNVGLGATISYLSVAGVGGTDENEVYLSVGPGKAVFANVDSSGFFNHVGVATINGFLNIISDSFNNAFVSTAFQANNVDLYKQDETNSTNPEFFYPQWVTLDKIKLMLVDDYLSTQVSLRCI